MLFLEASSNLHFSTCSDFLSHDMKADMTQYSSALLCFYVFERSSMQKERNFHFQ
jgi:hypothetical protein